MDLVSKIKDKREFRGICDSVVERVLNGLGEGLDEKEKVKEARRILRKYFGVFLTNKVLKPKNLFDFDCVLKSHKSSAKRNYNQFYRRIEDCLGEEKIGSFVDLGCGFNCFSYPYLREVFGEVGYKGIECVSSVVDNSNLFFKKKGFKDCECLYGDLFDFDFIKEVLLGVKKPRVVFCLQVVDALEFFEKDFSFAFLLFLKKNCEFIVLSLPVLSLSGKKVFEVKRNWLVDFLNNNFEIVCDFEDFGERFFVVRC